jgi:serine protease AprX
MTTVAAGILVSASTLHAAVSEYWVFLDDKPGFDGANVTWGRDVLQHENDILNLPLNPYYIDEVAATGATIRVCSRWFNAISVSADQKSSSRIEGLPFVRDLEPVPKARRIQYEPGFTTAPLSKPAQDEYGFSLPQLAQIGVIALHNEGYRGQGIRIALLDNGFHYTEHPAFEQLRIVEEFDFVNKDGIVSDENDQPITGDETKSNQNIHGAQVLSILGGFDPGRLVGVAPEAEFLLAKTENNDSELPIEEDWWIAGVEWADSLQADVINSSLGYNRWEDGTGYEYEDLDGMTARTTVAAEIVSRMGMVLVVSAGNEGDKPWTYITTPADADAAIAVGAVDARNRILAFSSRGPTADGRIKPDLVAPGGAVLMADVRNGTYLRNRGTSFAAPLVSGVCALLLQIEPLDPVAMRQRLRSTATDLGPAGPDTLYGWGLVNALAAMGVGVPETSAADSPYPNPNTSGIVHFPLLLAKPDEVSVRIFDIAGSIVDQLPPRPFAAGDFTRPGRALRWNVPADLGNGVYQFVLETTSFTRHGKIAVVRD